MIVVTWGDEATPLLSEEQIYDAIHFALASRFRLLRESRARKAQLGYRRHGTGGVGGDEFLKRRSSSERIQSGKIRFVFFVENVEAWEGRIYRLLRSYRFLDPIIRW